MSKLTTKLRQARMRVKNGKRTLMKTMLRVAHAEFDKNFTKQREVSRVGNSDVAVKWLPLKKARPNGRRTPILQDTRTLRKSVNRSVIGQGNKGTVEYMAFYSDFHNEGNSETNLPRRTFVQDTNAMRVRLNEKVARYIKRKLG